MFMTNIAAENTVSKGRFAPSPTGRMHIGNIFTALISWLSVKKTGGKWILRIEDLDPQRSKPEYARQIEDDLLWLGLEWDEGGMDDIGADGPYRQSRRTEIYHEHFRKLAATGLTYPCFCSRSDILATQAPHQNDGRVIYSGRCRPAVMPAKITGAGINKPHSTRILVPDKDISFDDRLYGRQEINLARQCGDFILRRSDGTYAYQLAVVVDDALMGVTEVVRGNDLMLSAAQQIYLYNLLQLKAPVFAHLPLICNTFGRRLSKRDMSLSMAEIRKHHSAEEVIGTIARLAGIIPKAQPCRPTDLLRIFDWNTLPSSETLIING